jgi:hypothetical protein
VSIYAPHPWDALPAAPPAPGKDYSDALDPLPVADALKAADLLRDAEDAEERAARCEDDADDYRREARKLIEAIRDEHPSLADAIEADPRLIHDEATVRRAARPADADPSQVSL